MNKQIRMEEVFITGESTSASLRRRANAAIPGGAHTYAKGDDQFPVTAPSFISRGHGCHVWDSDGNEFIEYGMGLRAVGLGHAFPAVVAAAAEELQRGANFTRPSPLEVECAESLLKLTPSAEMVKFTKDGSTATTAAVRLARAFTGRDMVALCMDHPFYSYDDWAICTKSMDAGIPESTKSLTHSFRYNDLPSLAAVFARFPGQIAAVILEAEKDVAPLDGFLTGIRELCTRNGALLIFDEMITGFRWPTCSAQRYYGIDVDLSTFGKALGNGFALSALAGKREIMERGGRNHGAERVFLLSSTHGAETHALAAALAVMKVYREEPVVETLERQGNRLKAGIIASAAYREVTDQFELLGRSSNMVYVCRDREGVPSQSYRTLFMQELARHGILAPSLVTSYSHSNDDIDRTIEAIDQAFIVYRRAIEDGVEKHLIGRSVRPVFSRDGDMKQQLNILHSDPADDTPKAPVRAKRSPQASSLQRSQHVRADQTRAHDPS